MNRIKEKKLAKRMILNKDRSSCCNEPLKTSKPGRVMCSSCNRFCKIVPGKKISNNNNYTTSIVFVILSALALIVFVASSVIDK